MAAAIIDAVNTVQADSEIRVAILKGAGNTFCSGGDLSDLQSGGKLPTVEDIRPVIANSTGIIAAIQKCPKPIFAMVEGYAVGAGFSGNGSAVEGDEGIVFSVTRVVDGLGDEFLSCAAFPDNQNISGTVGGTDDLLFQPKKSGCLPDQVV